MPHAPHAGAHPAARTVHRHPVHALIGRRNARWAGPDVHVEGCFKARPLAPKFTAVVSTLASPGVLTVAGMTALGAGAFGGASLLPTVIGPRVVIPGVRPHHHPHPGPPTPVSEPGTAALLAVAMVIVLFGAWLQGGRALRGRAESTIASTPLRRRRPVRSGPVPDPEPVGQPHG